jgi:hypothetical protein
MSESITLPTPGEIAARIRACREELAALRRLQRLARAADAVRRAQTRDTPSPASNADAARQEASR